MISSAVVETILNGAYVGAIAAILCVLYREHGLLNLAGAGWACLGAWLAATVVHDRTPIADNGFLLLLLVLAGTLSTLSLAVVRRPDVFTSHPTLFLFLGLACHIVISVGGGNSIPRSVSTTLPDGLFGPTRLADMEPLLCALVCLATPGCMAVLMRSQAFSRHALSFRRNANSPDLAISWKDRRMLFALVGLQLFLLLLLGSLSISTNQGNLTLASKHMAISAIVCIASSGRPWVAFVSSLGVSAAEFLLFYSFANSTVAFTSALLGFAFLTIVIKQPFAGFALSPANAWIANFDTDNRRYLFQLAIMIAAPGLLVLFWSLAGLSDSRLLAVMAVLTFSTLSFVGARCAGFSTAALPAFGAFMAYVVGNGNETNLLTVGLLIGLLVACNAYLYFVRFGSHSVVLITDLALILSAHDVLGLITGPDLTLHFPRLFSTSDAMQFGKTVISIWALYTACLLFAGWVHVAARGRMVAHALSDPLLARQNGLQSTYFQIGISTSLLVAAFLFQVLFCTQMRTISPSIADPQLGIAGLLIGYVMASDLPIRGFAIGLLLYALPEDLCSIVGIYSLGEYWRLLLLVPIFAAIYTSPEARQLWSERA